VLVAYFKIFSAPFAANDDAAYVLTNPDIRSFAPANIIRWFSTYYIGNYHPLTMLSFAVDYAIGGTAPFIYHLTSILLHCINSVLLYLLVRKISGQSAIALLVSLLFALHPSQTESVSWIAERKTVLCGTFSLLALLAYLGYMAVPAKNKLVLVTLLGIFALLSKATAVSLPLSFLAIDIWMRRDLTAVRLWLEKLPLLLCAGVIGVVAISAQASGHFLGLHPEIGLLQQVLLAANANVLYITHMLLPVHLSAIYPFPGSVGVLQYLCLLGSVGLIIVGIVAWKKQWHILCGGTLFYLVNIIPMLQLVQFGDFLMADRYSYMACIGIFLPLVYYPVYLLKSKRAIAIVVYAIASAGLLVATYSRNDIWLSELNFYKAILKTFPDSPVAQYSVGGLYIGMGKYDEAEPYIDKALQLAPRSHVAWYNKGVLCLRKGQANDALQCFDRCLAISPYTEASFSRAVIYMGTGRYIEAQADAEKVLHDQPGNARAWYIAAFSLVHQGNIPLAISCYTQAIRYEGRDPLFYAARADAYMQIGNYPDAITDLNAAIAISGRDGELYFKRAQAKFLSKQDGKDDMVMANELGYKIPAGTSIQPNQ